MTRDVGATYKLKPKSSLRPRSSLVTIRDTLVKRAREAGIEIPHRYDDDIPWEFRSAMEDALFQLDQKANQISYLQRKVDTLGRSTRIRKREDSGDHERRTSRRRESSREDDSPRVPQTNWRPPPMGERPPPPPSRVPPTQPPSFGQPDRSAPPNRQPQPAWGPPVIEPREEPPTLWGGGPPTSWEEILDQPETTPREERPAQRGRPIQTRRVENHCQDD